MKTMASIDLLEILSRFDEISNKIRENENANIISILEILASIGAKSQLTIEEILEYDLIHILAPISLFDGMKDILFPKRISVHSNKYSEDLIIFATNISYI